MSSRTPTLPELVRQIVTRADAGERLAVCTLVRSRGSTPQKPPAMMLVLADGQTLGTIGGGCVEAEVKSHALRQLAESVPTASPTPIEDRIPPVQPPAPPASPISPASPPSQAPSPVPASDLAPLPPRVDPPATSRLLEFKLDHDFGWDDGLVCGGTMEVAVQPIYSPDDAKPFRTLCAEDSRFPSHLSLTAVNERGDLCTFSYPLTEPPRLIIAGAGHVGYALARAAEMAGFDLVVADDRTDVASAARFPTADRRIGPIDQVLRDVTIDEQTYVVIVTRGHKNDASALAAVVDRSYAYLGLIGSRRKIITIYRDLRAAGVSEAALRRVHAPIGLAINAITPEEIAISILAELIAVRRGATQLPQMRLTEALLQQAFGDGGVEVSTPGASQAP